MKARYWKIRKEHKLCAPLADGVPARRNNSLPSWEGDRALDEYFGVPTAPRNGTLAPGAGPVDLIGTAFAMAVRISPAPRRPA